MDETLTREIACAQREDLPISVMMLDIDHFKKVNDTYGHEAGDLLLKTLANLLLSESRRSDIPCRYGGEEFCVIMVGAPMPIAAQRAEGWRRQFGETCVTYQTSPHSGHRIHRRRRLPGAWQPRPGSAARRR